MNDFNAGRKNVWEELDVYFPGGSRHTLGRLHRGLGCVQSPKCALGAENYVEYRA